MKLWLFLLLMPLLAQAESFYLTVPGEGWSLQLDAPAIDGIKGERKGRYYRVTAMSLSSGVTFSLHSETEASASHTECREKYWALSQTAPWKRENIRLFDEGNFAYVSHTMEVTYQGQLVKTANGHAYFVKNGLCMDLHVSQHPLQASSEKTIEAILRSLKLVP